MIDVLTAVALLVAGAALLTAGAEAFAENVTVAASRTGVSVLGLSLLLAGAEPEEAVTTMLAARQGHFALAAGDAIGANLVVLTLTLGLAALLTSMPVSRRVVEYAVAASAAGVLAVLFLLNGVLGRVEGGLLVAVYAVAVVWVWRREHEPPMVGEMTEVEGLGGPGPTDGSDDTAGRPLLMVLLGVVGMTVGGYLAVRGASGLVGHFGLNGSVVGLTLLALATSAEMLALVWSARRRGLTEVVVAGAIGAVAYNATVSLGLAGLVNPLLLGRHSQILVVAAITAVLPLVLVLRRRGRLPRLYGLPLVAVYVVVVGWLFGAAALIG